MKVKLLTTTIVAFLVINILNAQEEEFKPKGTVYGRVFFNYNMNFKKDVTESTFELQRAYLGYKYELSKEYTIKVLYDVGKPEVFFGDTLKGGETNFQMTAFAKEASLTYKKGNLTLEAGLITLLQHKVPETLWGHRYVARPYQDIIKICHVADLGVQAQYKIAEMLTLDFTVRNGEGFRYISQTKIDNSFRQGGGFTFTPIKGLILRGYYDFETKNNSQISISHAAGFSNDKFTVGAEYSFQLNNQHVDDHHVGGISAVGSYNITDKFEVFARYDYCESNLYTGETAKANKDQNFQLLIGGLQFTPIKNINIACDYQNTLYKDSDFDDVKIVYLHFQYVF